LSILAASSSQCVLGAATTIVGASHEELFDELMVTNDNDIAETAKERVRSSVFFFKGFYFWIKYYTRFYPEIVREL
jgi:hypothetical protein